MVGGGSPRTEVGSLGTDPRTEVESAGGTLDGTLDSDDDDSVTAEEIWHDEDILQGFTEGRKVFNLAIAFYYEKVLEPPSRSEWFRKSGTISHICDVFQVPTKKEE